MSDNRWSVGEAANGRERIWQAEATAKVLGELL
jgi:hypothetical protein